MKNLLQKDKKGISIMIGYVLLIVIAIGLSIMVFTYLRLYLPKDVPVCDVDVSLSAENVVCENGIVDITLRNNGLFNIDGAFIRIGDTGRIVKVLLNDEHQLIGPTPGEGLDPDESWREKWDYEEFSAGKKELEIEPFIFVENEPALCSKAIIKRNVMCTIS